MSYEMIDRFLRNNLGDDDYAKYSDALNALCTPQRTWVGLSKEDKWEIVQATERDDRGYVMALVEARLKELNT
jgi:hypothetical protein